MLKEYNTHAAILWWKFEMTMMMVKSVYDHYDYQDSWHNNRHYWILEKSLLAELVSIKRITNLQFSQFWSPDDNLFRPLNIDRYFMKCK